MSKTTKTKKVLAAGLAAVLTASTAMAGTLAWQSLNQRAVNVMEGTVNPGGRLHDDYISIKGYSDLHNEDQYEKNIYVENFGTQNIFARVQLYEFLAKADGLTREKVEKYGITQADITIGTMGTADDSVSEEDRNMLRDPAIYTKYDPNSGSTADLYWTKDWGNGGTANYIPTFNMNQDSLSADLNGEPDYNFAIINEGDPTAALDDDTRTYFEIIFDTANSRSYTEQYDKDDNTVDEWENGKQEKGITYVEYENISHYVDTTDSGTVMSMQEWIDSGKNPGPYWVYDAEGWFYWAQAIAPGYKQDKDDEDGDEDTEEYIRIDYSNAAEDELISTTGLLMDSLTDLGSIDNNYVYALLADAVFVTANDIGTAEDADGFYADTNGEELSDEVKEFLEIIGAVNDGRWDDELDESDEDSDYEDEYFSNTIALSPDSDNTLTGGEYLLFTAEVYDENGDIIAGTDDVTFSVREVMASDAAAASLFDVTAIDGHALFVADDIVDRGVQEIVVSASYTDDNGVSYDGEYTLEVKAADSPLEISLTLDGEERVYSYPESRTYQMFMADPSSKKYEFSAEYNSSTPDVTWSLVESSQYTVSDQDGCSVAFATGEWDDQWEVVAKGTEIAKINSTTGEFEILLADAFPRSIMFTIQAEFTDTDTGETFTNDSTLFIGRTMAIFYILNADVENPDSIDAHSATYTKGEESTIPLTFKLLVNDEDAEVDFNQIEDWGLYTEYNDEESKVDQSKYTITNSDNGDVTLTIHADSGIVSDKLYLRAKYNHGNKGPRAPDGRTEGVLNIYESSAAVDMNKIDTLTIFDESTGEEEATYTSGTYAKIRLEAVPTTASGDTVRSGNIIWSLDASSSADSKIKLIQDNYTAEVWILESTLEEITVTAVYSQETGGIQKDATFVITAVE